MRLLQPSFFKRMIFFILSDIVLFLGALLLAYGLRLDFSIEEKFTESFAAIFMTLAFIKITFFLVFNIYSISWRFFSLNDIFKITKALIAASLTFIIIFFMFNDLLSPMPRSVIIIDFFLSLSFVGLLRISKRAFLEKFSHSDQIPTIIFGVNSKTSSIIKSSLNGEFSYFPSAIVSTSKDDINALHTYMNNVKVYAFNELEDVVQKYKIKAALLTVELDREALSDLYEHLYSIGVHEVRIYNLFDNEEEKIEPICITDLLARHPKDLNPQVISEFIKGKNVLITGAGGSIGSEISRQCQNFGAASLALVDHAEYNLYKIKEELTKSQAKMVSVTDKIALERVFKDFKADIVIHAAAYKHVPLCEDNIESAIENNVLGTMNVIDLSIKYKVDKLVIISTDKAVRPTNVMGATKRVTELYAQNVCNEDTEIVAVRFGNVLDSSGSVIPKFKEQIEKGGPLTVTHKDMTRYFMLIPEACQLVLQAASIAKGNELFILDMGEPVKIFDLAERMIQLSGKEGEINIEFTGLRAGEKLYEELMLDESEQKTKYESIFITSPTDYKIDVLKQDISDLFAAENKITALQKIVPEFERRIIGRKD